ncbi:MAG: phosphoenolpyruvate carboxykinase (ATP), partial [Anaerolineae bacterium]|nr:phosphoenolpyruvate carboxykinase (ATP) [Anaerolineae bacterium]
LLKRKIEHHGATCWLVNTGWVGGPYGIGKRISIHYTRAILNAALEGKLNNVEYITDPIFGFFVPKTCPAIPNEVLDPASSWDDVEEYEKKYKQLALRFVDNFKKFAPDCPPELVKAGPKF